MRKIALLGLVIFLFLLVSCGPAEDELIEIEKTKIFISLDYPDEISSDQGFMVKATISNDLEFPITLSSMSFPFSDFKFNQDVEISTNVEIPAGATRSVEYNVERNMEAFFGSGLVSSMIQFDVRVNDPKGVRDFSKREELVIDVI